jgi:hypothetical protein
MAQPFALAVRCLLWQAVEWGDEAAAGTTSSSLLEMLLQQLQQSSLLQHLAALMAATAQQIWELQGQASAQALAADLADFAYKHKQDWLPSNSKLQRLHLLAGQLCSAAGNLREIAVSRCSWHVLVLAVAVSAVELSVLTMQHVSTCLELLPAHVSGPPQSLWRALSVASACVNDCMELCSSECSCCAGMRQELQDLPYFLPAFCSALLVASYGSLISKEANSWWHTAGAQAAAAAAAGGGGCGACSRGSSSRSSQEEQQQASWRQAAWSVACSARDALPLSHRELLRLVGCSSKALLWASTDSYSHAGRNLGIVSKVYQCLVQAVVGQVKQLLAKSTDLQAICRQH